MTYIPKACDVRKFQDFKSTGSYAEQSSFRKIARLGRGGNLTKADRSVLLKIVNLWFYHRGKTGYIEPGHENIERCTGLSERSVRNSFSKLRSLGIVVHLSGGRGRGKTAKYGVDLRAMLEVMWPDFRVKVAGVSALLMDAIKGAKTACAYIEDKTYMLGSAISKASSLSRAATISTLDSLRRRMTALAAPWFASQIQFLAVNDLPMELIVPGTGEVLALPQYYY